MNATLHIVDPHLDRLTTILTRFTRALIDIYLSVLSTIGNFFLIVLGSLFVVVSILNIINNIKNVFLAAVFIPIGLLLILSNKVRLVIWIFLGFAVLWVTILTAALIPFLGSAPSLSLLPQIVIAIAYFLPPAIATIVILRLIKAAEQGAAANP